MKCCILIGLQSPLQLVQKLCGFGTRPSANTRRSGYAQLEALRTRFICSINNEAVLKALFKVKDSDLTFDKVITVAMETENASKVAKETVYGKKVRVRTQSSTFQEADG